MVQHYERVCVMSTLRVFGFSYYAYVYSFFVSWAFAFFVVHMYVWLMLRYKNQNNKVVKDFGSFSIASSITLLTNGKLANLKTPPQMTPREEVKYKYTTYCEFQRHTDTKQSQILVKTLFMKNMLALTQSVDQSTAILSYDSDTKVNSICHPYHVPNETEEFAQYFPQAHIHSNKLTIKWRMTSTRPLIEIKGKLRPLLKECAFFIWSTPLKAIKIAKIGWLYQAYPDLIHRGEIITTLSLLIKTIPAKT